MRGALRRSRCAALLRRRGLSADAGLASAPPPPPPPPPPAAPRTSVAGGPVSWASLGLVALTGAGLVTLYNAERQRRVEEALARSAPRSAGRAAIGGPFALVEASSGAPFGNDALLGRFSLLYFGFTHCPDVCPDELVKLAEAVDLIERQTGRLVTPVFITLDPERDGTKQVAQYVKEFHPRLAGLTGPRAACDAAARAFRVYHSRTGDDPANYLVDHSIITYLLDPEGQFLAFYGKQVAAPELAAEVGRHVAAWRWDQPQQQPPPQQQQQQQQRQEEEQQQRRPAVAAAAAAPGAGGAGPAGAAG